MCTCAQRGSQPLAAWQRCCIAELLAAPGTGSDDCATAVGAVAHMLDFAAIRMACGMLAMIVSTSLQPASTISRRSTGSEGGTHLHNTRESSTEATTVHSDVSQHL